MAFNKSKSLESALKLLNQGKISQAIGEYQQVLRQDPKDQVTLMTVGDLYARQGDMPHAIEYFEQLAKVYLNEGFNSKAIAIYKKIAKLAPAELAPLERLADLYVQQGVLSEARPLFLQIAEAHLKANRAPKAVGVLHHLLEVEPDNPRVQMRLAELYNAMGQKKEAAQTYLNYAQRLFDRGETGEAQKLAERGLEVDPGNSAALFFKARILAAADQTDQAIQILENHPEADAGTEVTNLLVDLELKAGHAQKAADRGRNQLVRGNAHFGLLLRITDSVIENGSLEEAMQLLGELRDPMTDAGEQDKFLRSLTNTTERFTGRTEPLEMLADFCRHSSDPFRLNDALSQLADIYAADGNYARAEEFLEEMVERNKGDERLVARLSQLRAKSGRTAESQPNEDHTEPEATIAESQAAEIPPAPVIMEDPLDEETQRYVTQALTDVDLFSSYGLVQKASYLLENILQRAPRHTAALERLLDLSLGAGDEERTHELAVRLEKIHREHGDFLNAERFKELSRRFQSGEESAAGEGYRLPDVTTESVVATVIEDNPESETSSMGAIPVDSPPEFVIEAAPAAAAPEFEIPVTPAETMEAQEPVFEIIEQETPAVASGEAVDLSDEWEAMAREDLDPPVTPAESETHQEIEVPAAEPVREEFELELIPAQAPAQNGASTTEDLISELVAEIDGLESPAPSWTATPEQAASVKPAEAAIPETTAESLNHLSEVFQEFRDELGELGEEDEDLETHYNLGIAYREMGLLDEAIGEFQKVAKAIQKGKPFRYAMNCSTLLALSFRDKGEPKIASLWYRQALDVPGLDQEAILALRYDLGVSLEMAGEYGEALDCFRQVYAANIDYRDVSERIAALQRQPAAT